MLVVCKVAGCPYRSKLQFCRNRVAAINQNGQCSHIYNNNGSVNPHWQEPIDEIYLDGYRPPKQQQQEIKQIEIKGESE